MARLPDLSPLPLERRPDPFDDPGYIFETKIDGFRALAFVERGRARLVSRRGLVYRRFDGLCAAVAASVRARAAVLDGEIACLDEHGRSMFLPLLRRRGVPCFVAFDLLWLDGRDLRARPLGERKRRLRAVLRPAKDAPVLYLQHVVGTGRELFAYADALDLEGIVAKVAGSPYALVRGRSPWTKIKRRDYSQAIGREDLFARRYG